MPGREVHGDLALEGLVPLAAHRNEAEDASDDGGKDQQVGAEGTARFLGSLAALGGVEIHEEKFSSYVGAATRFVHRNGGRRRKYYLNVIFSVGSRAPHLFNLGFRKAG
jgi:hypothetical protein